MTPLTDQQLLRQFVQTRDQKAFAQIASRHLQAVFASARRQVRDPALAEDVAQTVFLVLARNAAKLGTTARKGSALACSRN